MRNERKIKQFRKTKIICTIGPVSESEEMIRALIQNGMDVARLNFSHGDHAEHKRRIELIRKVAKELNRPVAVLLDTKGPEIRLKTFKEKKVLLTEGKTFTLRAGDITGDENGACVTYDNMANEVSVGTQILLDDGLVEMDVEKIENGEIICRIKNSGYLSDHKSINIPSVHLDFTYISERDEKDILFGIENDVDYIAASFCRTAMDALAVRKLLDRNGGQNIQIIAKIENASGVNNIDEILKVTDGVMVARG